MSIVRIDPEGRRNAEHIAIIVVVDLVPIQCHFRSRQPQAFHNPHVHPDERQIAWTPLQCRVPAKQ